MATTPDVTRLGVFAALRKATADEFASAFESVTWTCDEDAEHAAKRLPAIKAETLYYAARELVRNAARHAQPSAGGLHLAISATCTAGFRPPPGSRGPGGMPTATFWWPRAGRS